MTLFAPTVGQRILKAAKLTTTSATTLATAAEKRILTLDSLYISAGVGGATISVWVSDGTTDYYLLKAYALAAATSIQISSHHIPLQSGWTLKAQAGTANVIDLTAVLIQSNPTQQQINATLNGA